MVEEKINIEYRTRNEDQGRRKNYKISRLRIEEKNYKKETSPNLSLVRRGR